MKFTPEEQAVLRQADAIISSKMIGTDYMTSPDAVRALLRYRLAAEQREVFCILHLDNQNGVIAFEEIFHGTINAVSVHPRVVLQQAMHHNSKNLILVHNHPSGKMEPSQADKLITDKLVNLMNVVEVGVLDHMIVCGDKIYSFSEHGLL